MNETEHTFPLPETAAHLLEEVEDTLEHQPLYLKARDYAHANPWATMAVVGGIALLLGICAGRRS